MNNQGFIPIFVVIIILILSGGVVGGAIYVKQNHPWFIEKITGSNPEPTIIPTTQIPTVTPPSSTLTDWKSLEVKSCAISLKYPSDWKFDIFEHGSSCQVRIIPLDIQNKASFIVSTTSKPDFPSIEEYKDLIRQNQFTKDVVIEDITIDGAPAIITQTQYDNNLTSESLVVKKGGVAFLGSIKYKTTDNTSSVSVKGILNSIKFTAPESSYKSDPNDNFQYSLAEDAVYKTNAEILVDAIVEHQRKTGKLPNSLEDLDSKDFVAGSGSVYELFSKYTYKRVANSFTISIKLSNGSEYTTSPN